MALLRNFTLYYHLTDLCEKLAGIYERTYTLVYIDSKAFLYIIKYAILRTSFEI